MLKPIDVLTPEQVAEIRETVRAPFNLTREKAVALCDTVDDLREQLRKAKPALLRAIEDADARDDANVLWAEHEDDPERWEEYVQDSHQARADAATLRALVELEGENEN